MTAPKLPSTEDFAAQWGDELARMLRSYGRAVLETAASVTCERCSRLVPVDNDGMHMLDVPDKDFNRVGCPAAAIRKLKEEL